MTHTAEEVRDLVSRISGHAISVAEKAEVLFTLIAYAALLERREAGVTAEVTNAAKDEFAAWMSLEDEEREDAQFDVAMQHALKAVWPVAAEVPEGCTPTDAAVLRKANHDLAGEADRLRQALQFYADQQHLVLNEPGSWDSVSGEGPNWLCDSAGTATVENGWVARNALETTGPVAAEPAQEVPVAYLAKNANEAFLFFADDHEGLDDYTADGFSITPLVRHSTPDASCGDCPTRDYKAAEPVQPADSGRPDEVARIVQRRATLAQLPGDWAAHSLRSGFVTEAGRQGVPLGEVMAMTEHRSVGTVMGYFQAGALLSSRATDLLAKK